MGVVGRLANLLDAVLTGRPPRVIDRQFGWLRDLGFRVGESGWRGMELYATYASERVLVRVLEEYHYGFVGVRLAKAPSGESGQAGSDVALGQLLATRAPHVRWDGNYDIDDRGAGEAKLGQAAQLLREQCSDLLLGDNLHVLERGLPSGESENRPNSA